MKTPNTENSRKSQKERLYIAYGSNLNTIQMSVRCPTAKIAGTATLKGWRLIFRNVATIERCAGHSVPVLIWKLQSRDELALDRYEGWPHLYPKETLRVTLNGKRRTAMAYIMNEDAHPYSPPSRCYLETILQGYKDAHFDKGILYQASADSMVDTGKGG